MTTSGNNTLAGGVQYTIRDNTADTALAVQSTFTYYANSTNAKYMNGLIAVLITYI
jgi:hypothetical protein